MKRLVMAILALLLLLPAVAEAQVTGNAVDSVTVSPEELADRIIEEAYRHLGKPYRWAGNGPNSFDCTGLTQYVYKQFGYKIGRTVRAQAQDGRPIEGDISLLQKGDILIFGARLNRRAYGHAGLYIGPDSTGNNFFFVHASNRGVIVSSLKEVYYSERFLGAVRILPDFLPTPDSTHIDAMAAVLDTNVVVIVPPDTLSLEDGYRRIVLMEKGGWAFIDSSGILHAPTAESGRLVLNPDGSWQVLPASSLRIPVLPNTADASATDATPPATSSPSATPAAPAGGVQYHTIQSGDTLSGIARKYHTTVNALCQLNGITAKTTLRVGKKLRVK